MVDSVIIKSKVCSTLAHLNKKSLSEDGIVTEMLPALYNFVVDKVTEIIKEIYDNGEILEDHSNLPLITILKTSDECDHYQTISLMSHIAKLKILIK